MEGQFDSEVVPLYGSSPLTGGLMVVDVTAEVAIKVEVALHLSSSAASPADPQRRSHAVFERTRNLTSSCEQAVLSCRAHAIHTRLWLLKERSRQLKPPFRTKRSPPTLHEVPIIRTSLNLWTG